MVRKITRFDRNGVGYEGYEHNCKVCNITYWDPIDMQFLCSDCENEYAEWLDEKGYEVGEFDRYDSPHFVPDPHAGTKWKKMEG